jgi:hypothetical protein
VVDLKEKTFANLVGHIRHIKDRSIRLMFLGKSLKKRTIIMRNDNMTDVQQMAQMFLTTLNQFIRGCWRWKRHLVSVSGVRR